MSNKMLGRPVIESSTAKDEQDAVSPQRPSKRRKISNGGSEDYEQNQDSDVAPRSPPPQRREIADSDAESGDEPLQDNDDEISTQRTDLEQALPPIKTDRQAIADYEAMRSAEAATSPDMNERLNQRAWVKGKSSIYVDAFNLALDTVLEEESHLFDAAEMRVFEDWRALSYEAQYLYVRLFLRKTSAWHRINRLGYYGDIADLHSAVDTLQMTSELPTRPHETKVSPGELQPPGGTILGDTYTFADSSQEHITTLEEASSLLRLDELKDIAKEAKVQGKNKSELLRNLRRTSGKQTSLGFAGLKRSDTEESYNSPIPDSRDQSPEKRDGTTVNRDEYFTSKILAGTGPCIRLSLAPFTLFERVHLIFYRSTEWTEKSLTTIILARIARRNFPEYIVSRSANIFPSRALVLEFEASLRTQFRIDSILEFSGTPTKESLQIILDIFEEVLPRWRVLLEEEQRKEDSVYSSGEGAYLRRLSPAWVYTRIVHKGAYVLGLGKFKDHAREHATLEELLQQGLFHHSRRGAWYQRKALLEEHYMGELRSSEGRAPDEQKKHWKRIALATCEQGLQDNLVHLIYHYDLQKRVTKLEKSLKIAKRLQHDFGHTRLAKPDERTYTGIQIEKRLRAVPLNLARTSSNGSTGPPRRDSNTPKEAPTTRKASGKTVWLDPGSDEPTECSVESMCLSNYRSDGWKGFHSEGGILRTLFALLMYDVLFVYVPNVFQTPFQTCPLDLHTDAFYPTRLSEINSRLAEISNGDAASIINSIWDREGERKTCVVGLHWDFERDDLLEIVECFRAEQLATLCKVMAQEYAQRGGGVPDLFLWSLEKKECCFAEVKSENDRLSDTQRMWIHVLAGAGIRVELCHAVARVTRVRQ